MTDTGRFGPAGLDELKRLAESLVGRTITAASAEDLNPDHEWAEHEVVDVTLDDGRTIRFGSWGYDCWGADAYEINQSDEPREDTR